MKPIYELTIRDKDGTFKETYKSTQISMLYDSDTGVSVKHSSMGPAVQKADGTKEWWIEGKQLTEEKFNKYLKMKAFW
jgi:hypothetical protein